MIFDSPPDQLLRTADIISLFDPRVPAWHEVVVNNVIDQSLSPKDFTVVDIPVDSANWVAVQKWRDRIATARKA
jgi:hypothetical protein